MVHKPKHKVHSFRGSLDDGGQAEINLERQNVNVAYRVIKFQMLPLAPGLSTQEIVGRIFREKQTTISTTVDFNDQDLLGAGVYMQSADSYNSFSTVIFDNTLFSRNIFINIKDAQGIAGANYYIELEEVPVGAATLMQLKLGVARKLNLSQDPVPT